VGSSPLAAVETVQVMWTVLLPGTAEALASVGAFSVPTLALALVEPVAVQKATATVPLNASRTGTRMKSWRARITWFPS
jgi:hypothetical protein